MHEINKKNEKFNIIVTSDYPAFFVSFDTEGIQGKFSENMFTLLPNKPKQITYTPDDNIDIDIFKKALSIYDLRHTY